MINYRVQNIEELVNKLKENGVTILDSIATYDYGKFVHIMDAEGNKLIYTNIVILIVIILVYRLNA